MLAESQLRRERASYAAENSGKAEQKHKQLGNNFKQRVGYSLHLPVDRRIASATKRFCPVGTPTGQAPAKNANAVHVLREV